MVFFYNYYLAEYVDSWRDRSIIYSRDVQIQLARDQKHKRAIADHSCEPHIATGQKPKNRAIANHRCEEKLTEHILLFHYKAKLD